MCKHRPELAKLYLLVAVVSTPSRT